MKRLLSILAAVLCSAGISMAAIPLITGPLPPSDIIGSLNGLIQTLNSNAFTQGLLAPNNFRNLLDNGAMQVQQRGTGAATCATTSAAASANYGADRWVCDVNVTSGAGQLTAISSSPTPPTGFKYAQKLARNSGALTQPQCVWQEIPSADVITTQGQSVTFSWYDQALAGLAADNGNVINAYIVYGTGTDEGFGTWTASPAITPAFTGVNSSATAAFTISATQWLRHSLTAVMPVTATEAAVALCFTPTATGAGATDGFAFTGAQFEVGSNPSPYEFKPYAIEQLKAYRYAYTLTEPAANIIMAQGQSASTTLCSVMVQFPATMAKAPTFTALGTALSNATWKVNQAAQNLALATTYLVTLVGNSTSTAQLTATTAASQTAGWGCQLVGAGGGSILMFSADF